MSGEVREEERRDDDAVLRNDTTDNTLTREEREARVHPRKWAVVSLAEGCVAEATSTTPKKTHDFNTALR